MLNTDRLILRGPRDADIDAMFATYSDPVAMRYWSTPPHANRDVTAADFIRRKADWDANKRNFQIEMDGVWIGNAGMFRDYEVGFMLSRVHWRKGIVSEAMGTIIPYLFDTINVPYMTADADPNNAASCGILRALGFHETHRAKDTFCINGVWSDSVYFRRDP
ncbi:GNAT family N-acetyltransferase [Yoonia sp. 208BN28-4]|uniref:GNAT family N-acetyltransferase n=1 Tax=Yoonia sp. 208BN28-4 TaxID=3126505 RepID=UPI0030B4A2C3